MNQDEAIEVFESRKLDGFEVWSHATLVDDLEFPDHHTEGVRVVPAGTRVLITMFSRFGDVGIRDRDLKNYESHYYLLRVPLDGGYLKDFEFVPGAEGIPWRREFHTKYGPKAPKKT